MVGVALQADPRHTVRNPSALPSLGWSLRSSAPPTNVSEPRKRKRYTTYPGSQPHALATSQGGAIKHICPVSCPATASAAPCGHACFTHCDTDAASGRPHLAVASQCVQLVQEDDGAAQSLSRLEHLCAHEAMGEAAGARVVGCRRVGGWAGVGRRVGE